ncbi:MAG TPA: TIGR01777 family oxidoreductase [Chitinophagaceae bacterium]
MPVVLITGGTGLIGKNLTRHLTAKGYNVIIMSRKPSIVSNDPMIAFANWNIDEQKIDSNAIAKADYIINLVGAGVMEKKWTEKYKKEIVESRTKSGELLIKALQENTNHVKAIISASGIGWYGEDSKPLLHTNGFIETDPADENFLGETCKLWEESIAPVTNLNKRLVKFRTGIVLSNDGGAFTEFKKSLRFGIAAILGGGKQIISWIHMDDLCRMYIYAIENEQLSGSYNAVAPQPVNNKTLILKLAKKMRRQFYIPFHVPQFLLKLILGERSIEILKSATVSCEKIKATGFTFLYPSIDAALKELTGILQEFKSLICNFK